MIPWVMVFLQFHAYEYQSKVTVNMEIDELLIVAQFKHLNQYQLVFSQ